MSDRRAEHRGKVSPFMGPSGTFPADLHTLSDEIPREPTELESEKRGPVAEKKPNSLRDRIRRLLRGAST